MSEIILTLGSIAFRDFEVPEAIVFGGNQVLAAHQLIGGERVVDSLGSADGQIVFSGIFSGPNAATRAQVLDVARSLGQTLPLAWRGFSYPVIIETFDMAYKKPWWIPFRLRLIIVRDLAVALPTAAVQAVLDVASALGFAAQGGISIAGVSAASEASINSGFASVSQAVSQTGATLAGDVGQLNGAADPVTAAAAIKNASSNAGALAGLVNVRAYLGRATAIFGD